MAFRKQGPPATADDDPTITLADIEEQIAHLNYTAKRQAGTAYYERTHARINDVLDLWQIVHEYEQEGE